MISAVTCAFPSATAPQHHRPRRTNAALMGCDVVQCPDIYNGVVPGHNRRVPSNQAKPTVTPHELVGSLWKTNRCTAYSRACLQNVEQLVCSILKMRNGGFSAIRINPVHP